MDYDYNREEQEIEELSKSITLESILSELGQDETFAAQSTADTAEENENRRKNSGKRNKRNQPKRLQAEESVKNLQQEIKHSPDLSYSEEDTMSLQLLAKREVERKEEKLHGENQETQLIRSAETWSEKEITAPTEDLPGKKEKPEIKTLHDVMASVVDEELQEQEKKRKAKSPSNLVKAIGQRKRKKESPAVEPYWQEETIEEEYQNVDVSQVCRDLKKTYRRTRQSCIYGGAVIVVLVAIWICQEAGWISEEIQQLSYFQMAMGCLLLITNILERNVWKNTLLKLKSGWISFEFAACFTNAVTLIYCITASFMDMTQPALVLPSATLLLFTSIGLYRKEKADFEAFRLIKKCGEPPTTVVRTKDGVIRQIGSLKGFYETLTEESNCDRTEKVMVPLELGTAIALTAMVYMKTKDASAFLWTWSMLLCMGFPLSQAIAKSHPYATLQKMFSKKDIAVAGLAGAQPYARMRRMVLTETELFPRDQIVFEGSKTVAEDPKKVLSYATSIAKTCGSYLFPSFDQELLEQGGFHCQVDDIHFYEDGGISAMIHGETVLLGNERFMRAQHISIPREKIKKSRLYLSIDGVLACVFGFTFGASKNVEWALRALKRNHIRPVLAVRSCNINKSMIEEKFGLETKAVFPKIDERVKLSNLTGNTARKNTLLIYRGELVGMVEAAVASKKMARSTWTILILSYINSFLGMFLTSYLAKLQSFTTLTPVNLVLFGILWLVPSFLLGRFCRHI